jgi:hypothetical protein
MSPSFVVFYKGGALRFLKYFHKKMGDIRAHPQTLRVKECVLAAVKPDERDRVRLSEPIRRQMEGRLVVENFDSLCVTKLIETLPRRSRVYSRAPNRGGAQVVVLSRLDVYYPLDEQVWRVRKIILFILWVVMPVVGALTLLFT